MKNIEWLQREIHKELESWQGVEGGTDGEGINEIMLLIDQLDEPEVLSQEWIERNTSPVDDEGRLYIWNRDLENLLVPKQELPAIPDYVADWLEAVRNHYSLGAIFHDAYRKHLGKTDIETYIFNNQNTFARAWLDGFMVEEEQKYVISININDKASKTNYETFLNKRGIFHSMDNDSFNSEEFNWSEEEIKDLENGEILFRHFAVKVEELEE